MNEMGTLKEVSKTKHRILRNYFPAWARILGSWNSTLVYVDCFAGAGQYAQGEPGSPLIIFRTANELIRGTSTRKGKKAPFSLYLFFVEKDQKRANALQSLLREEARPFRSPSQVKFEVIPSDAEDFTSRLIRSIPRGLPAFFFIDPYGHPLPIPLINQILAKPRTEVLLVLMWFAINMHLNNPKVSHKIDEMFGHHEWANQPFMHGHGREREQAFLDYFIGHIQAKYVLPFQIMFSPEDRIRGKGRRTKYYIIHFSNHVKAALLMKEVMWPLGDEEGTFVYSAASQLRLFSQQPSEIELTHRLLETFQGRAISFDQIRMETWNWPFLEKHYRKALKNMESQGIIKIQRRESKRSGLKGKDLVIFPGNT